MNGSTSTAHPRHTPCGVVGVRAVSDRTAGRVRDEEGHFASRAQEGRTGAVDHLAFLPPYCEVPESAAPVPVLLPPVTGGADSMGADWPLVNYLRLWALPPAVPCARLQVKVLLLEWELKKLSEPAELCVAELISNAVKAVQDMEPALRQPIGLRLSSDGARLLIQIWDCNPALPVKREMHGEGAPELELEGGRGLFLVKSYSERWDFYPTAQWGGKVVWCVVADR